MREQLMTLKLEQLRIFAKDFQIPGFYKMKKNELIDAIIAAAQASDQHEANNEKSSTDDATNAPVVSEATSIKSVSSEGTKQELAISKSSETNETTRKPVQENRLSSKHTYSDAADSSYKNSSLAEESSKIPSDKSEATPRTMSDLDTGNSVTGILEVIPDNGYGFIRSDGYFSGENDVYVSAAQIKRFSMKSGDEVSGNLRTKNPGEKFNALLRVDYINGMPAEAHTRMIPFENLTPVFPHDRLHLEYPGCEASMRIVDLLCPIGKGQRGMIVAQPKVGKTTLLKQFTKSLVKNHPELKIIILLIDERPEEVTDMVDTFEDTQVEIDYSTFDKSPEDHRKITELVLERAKRLVECHQDVVILLDSITRLTRAYNLICTPSGRTLSGGLDPAALYAPKRFFGAARAMREGGSLTILATALQETGSRLDDMVYEEFKGTGNMELVLSRRLSERRIFPAIDILKSSTRRDDLLLSQIEQDTVATLHRVTAQDRTQDRAAEAILDLFA